MKNRPERKDKTIPGKFYAWLLTLAYLLHLIEEFFAASGFPYWFSSIFGADISNTEYVAINSLALIMLVIFSSIYQHLRHNVLILLTLTAVFLINGILHAMLSLFTLTYSPGTITGVAVYFPLGIFLFRKIGRLLSLQQRITAIVSGLIIHILVIVIAYNI